METGRRLLTLTDVKKLDNCAILKLNTVCIRLKVKIADE